MEEEPLDDAEKWCDDAKKLTLRTRDGDLLGTVYLDLSRRPRKFPHAAHFVVRCSRDAREGSASRKRPVVALVCNFGGGAGFSAGALLSHGEVETFLHEFGHAMHSALSETKYQHLSGRGARRFLRGGALAPLRVLRAWDPDALRILSRERTTGEPMPSAMITRFAAGKEMFGATDLRQQIAFALADLDAHSIAASDVEPRRVSAAFADAARSAGFRPEPGASWELRFGHLVGYASTYYSYVYARCAAAEAWRRWFAGTRSRRARGGGEGRITQARRRRRAGHTPQKRAGGGWTQERSRERGNSAESKRRARGVGRAVIGGGGERRTRESIRGPPSGGNRRSTDRWSPRACALLVRGERRRRRNRSGENLCVVTRRFSIFPRVAGRVASSKMPVVN